jgi:hypothetical protein
MWRDLEEMESNRRGKKQAIFKIHCPVRFQGNYISRTLETDLANFLLKLQGKNQDSAIKTESAKWIKTLLEKNIDKEDIKFVQFINIRALSRLRWYPSIDSTTEKKYDSYRATELHRVLPFGHKLNPLKTGAWQSSLIYIFCGLSSAKILSDNLQAGNIDADRLYPNA